mmetsp:Transcript_8557/g.15827  ORF Transcript_8557/g.15827 Transcript_8557/m.15827 type:complete len:114 (-) Transcript_8557:447-788(-)
MAPEEKKKKKKKAAAREDEEDSQKKEKVELPPYSLFGPQYRGLNLGILGSSILLLAYVQTSVHSDWFIWSGFLIVLVGLFFHEIRPIKGRGYGDITDEFKERLNEEDKGKKRD